MGSKATLSVFSWMSGRKRAAPFGWAWLNVQAIEYSEATIAHDFETPENTYSKREPNSVEPLLKVSKRGSCSISTCAASGSCVGFIDDEVKQRCGG